MKVRGLAIFLLFVLCSNLEAQNKPVLSVFKENYFIAGAPLNTKPDYSTNDVTFQISTRFNLADDMRGTGWDMFLGYTQFSVWEVCKPSNPFKENTYMPGFYLSCDTMHDGGGETNLLMGIEHRSNGRDGTLSRCINDVFLTWTHTFPCHLTLQASGRYGIGSIGNTLNQDMFLKYQGYGNVAAAYSSPDRRFVVSGSFTPLFQSDIVGNISADLSFRPVRKKDWLYLTLKYHYGYDECQIDCSMPDVFLKQMLRVGFSVQPQSISHKLAF